MDQALVSLQRLEVEQQQLDKKVQKYKIEITKPVFEKRRKVIANIPQFWYIVLAQHEDFQEYITTEDMKYLEFIKDIYVEKMVDKNGANDDPQTFRITFQFEAPNGEIDSQTVSKYFYTETDGDNGFQSIKSHPVAIEWPKDLQKINPELVKAHRVDHKWTPEQKKNYRAGMKSFFAFFEWTGLKEGKEYRYGEQLAEMFSEDIFPLAVDYYTLAAPGLGNDDDDDAGDSSSEELDIDEDEDGDNEPEVKKQKI